MDQEEIARYELVKATGVCPDCGQDVERTTLGKVLAATGDKAEEDEDVNAIAYACVHQDCHYSVSIGEMPVIAAAS